MANLVCTISLDKSSGILVRIEAEGTTQTVTLDGTSITLEVKGSSGTSKIVQTADEVHVECRTFTVDASANVRIKAGAELVLQGTSKAEVSAATLALEADGVATLKGSLTNVQGQAIKLG